ncbi:MAG: prolyl oligopeptidase family serine peptidase [Verrucomicrobiales bacterium]|nr:prolyl oligopeptidase family serine peptidase [Verrucomicrobiales bacterium]
MRAIRIARCLLFWVGFTGFLAAPAAEEAPPQAPKQDERVFTKDITRPVRMNYLLHLPASYRPDGKKTWPLLVFLHGSGEKGTNVALVRKNGPPKLAETNANFPFILLSPQSPPGQYGWSEDAVIALIDEVAAHHAVDRKRIYLTGLSMGGYGTWTLATSHPHLFAAIAPVCGGGDSDDVAWVKRGDPKAFESLGVWAFHGAKDNVVPLSESQDMVRALKETGCRDIQLTVFPEAGHDAWTEAYSNPKLYEWFLRHRLE